MSDKGYLLKESDLLPLSIGAALLGTGGGGNPYVGMLRARELIRQGAEVRVLPLDALPDDAWVGEVGGIGAPVVGVEKDRGRRRMLPRHAGGGRSRRRQDLGHHLGRDRRLQRARAGNRGGLCGPASDRRRRHGPGLPRSADDHLLHLWRQGRSGGHRR